MVQYGLAPGSITAAVACMVAAVSRTRRSSVCADQCRASVLEVLPPTGSRGCVVVQDPLAGGGWSAGTFSPRLCACRAERRVMPSHQQHGARPRSRRRPLKGGRVSFGRRRGAVSRHPRRPRRRWEEQHLVSEPTCSGSRSVQIVSLELSISWPLIDSATISAILSQKWQDSVRGHRIGKMCHIIHNNLLVEYHRAPAPS